MDKNKVHWGKQIVSSIFGYILGLEGGALMHFYDQASRHSVTTNEQFC
jgi:hypothetical protein